MLKIAHPIMGHISKSLRPQTQETGQLKATGSAPIYTVPVRPHLVQSTVAPATEGRHRQSTGPKWQRLPFAHFLGLSVFEGTFRAPAPQSGPIPCINSQKMTWPQRSPTTQVHFLFPQAHLGVEEVFFPV